MVRASRVEPVWHRVRGCEQAQEVAQRDSNPSRAHAQLMPQLVDGLLEQEDIEQNLPVLLRRWYEMRMNGPQVSAQKRR